MKFSVVIPARYKSSRFPGKPLADILGKPMIQHVWEKCCQAVGSDKVFVATDDELINKRVIEFGGQSILTSQKCMTGTDRLAEANGQLDCDFLINVQGDEPLVNPEDIKKVISVYTKNPNVVVNAMAKIDLESDFRSSSVPKVVFSKSGKLLYMSRGCIPTDKHLGFASAYRQVCIYAFSRHHLKEFSGFRCKSPIEKVEDIEILRFLENDISVQMVEVEGSNIAVDFPEDVERVVGVLNSMGTSD